MKTGRTLRLKIIGIAMFALGMVLLNAGSLIKSRQSNDLRAVNFPLSDSIVVAQGSDGRIYVGDNFYDRIQRYSSTGEFETGWFVESHGAAFILGDAVGGQIQVGLARREGLLTYSIDGRLISRVSDDDAYSHVEEETSNPTRFLVIAWPFPHVVDSRTNGTVISSSWPKRLIAAPLPAMGYCAIGVLLVFIGERLGRRDRRTNVE